MWVLDHLDDLASDFSVFHGIWDMWALPGPVFFKLAWRLSSYRGVMRDVAMVEVSRQRETGQPATPAGTGDAMPADMPVPAGATRVGATRAELMSDPLMSKVISFG